MNFDEFKAFILANKDKWCPADWKGHAEIKHVRRATTAYDGIALVLEDGKVTPVINLNHLFIEYKDGKSISEICVHILEAFSDQYTARSIEKDFSEILSDYSKAKQHLCLIPMNKTKSSDYLEHAVYKEIGDIAFVVTVIKEYGKENYTMKVLDVLLNHWNVSADTVYYDAINSMVETAPPVSIKMNAILGVEADPTDSMIVISNKNMQYGASVIEVPGYLQEVAKDIGDLYIFPSSVNEVIAVKAKINSNINDMKTMIRDINRSDVISEEDYLSDQLMYYNADRDEITVI